MNISEAAEKPLWWEVVEARLTRPALDGDISVDVAIVGAGFTAVSYTHLTLPTIYSV